MAARKKTLLSIQEALEMVFEDSPSEDSDLITHRGDSNDSDYEVPPTESEEDDNEMASGSQPSTSASKLQRQSKQHSEPATPKLRRRASASVVIQPASASSDEDAPFEPPCKRKGKRKASKKAVAPSKRGRGASSRTTEEEPKWHSKEENDICPEPLRFMPARIPGPTFDTTALWSPLSLFRLFFSNTVINRIETIPFFFFQINVAL
ncbi:uncharacterized protein LOC117486558 [Trematomus bernacchii]|uniref:uncharacterized protein LOC117486558 n=1 Tax=Trematomus bernacchii TaxID=40690 RepID=UPI00146C2812|nr:uncharacterized protein LOC117486558 [Trematomus bernacchii]